MKKLKRVIAILFAMSMLFVTVACSQTPEAPAEPPANDGVGDVVEEPPADVPEASPFAGTTITLMASQDWVQDVEIEVLAPKFTEETGITVDFQIIPSEQYPNLLMTRLNTGEVTDIFMSQGGRADIVTLLDVERHAVDLSGEEWASRLDPLAAYEVSVDGRLFGQPLFDISSVWAIAYNKAIFAELELEVPTTFDEFMEVSQTILDAGITPIYQPVADGWHHVLWFPEIGPVIEQREPGTIARLNANEQTLAESETAALIIDQISEMVDRGFWGEFYMSNEFVDAARFFADGSYAMFLGNPGFLGDVADADPDFNIDDIGFFVIPLADNQILNINPVCPTRFISSNSDNIEAAKLYLEFLARPENLQILIDNVARFSTLPISGATARFPSAIQALYDRFTVHGTVLQSAVTYVNPQWMEIGSELVNVIQGQNDAVTMLENLDRNRASQADAAGDPNW